MINFPEDPEIDDTHSAGGRTWKWSGSRWLAVNGTVSVAPGGGVTSYNDLTNKPGDATTTVAGFMSSADKTKLDGVATGATAYTHPTGDGNLHVPATSTTNNGKVLKAGATAGSLSWGSLTATDVGGVSNGGGAASIMVLTNSQYNAIPAGSIDNNTIYIII